METYSLLVALSEGSNDLNASGTEDLLAKLAALYPGTARGWEMWDKDFQAWCNNANTAKSPTRRYCCKC